MVSVAVIYSSHHDLFLTLHVFKAVFLLKINNNWTFHIDVKLHFIYKYFILYFYFLFLQIHL